MATEPLNVVCSQCASVNRVPSDRLNDGPVCGKCKAELLPEKPVELDTNSFARFIEKNDLPVVVDFWAPWCQPCKMMGPHYAKAAGQLRGRAILAKLDTQDFPEPASPYGIAGIPTMIVFRNGKEHERVSGAMQDSDIVAWVRESIG